MQREELVNSIEYALVNASCEYWRTHANDIAEPDNGEICDHFEDGANWMKDFLRERLLKAYQTDDRLQSAFYTIDEYESWINALLK